MTKSQGLIYLDWRLLSMNPTKTYSYGIRIVKQSNFYITGIFEDSFRFFLFLICQMCSSTFLKYAIFEVERNV